VSNVFLKYLDRRLSIVVQWYPKEIFGTKKARTPKDAS
jgi:hypothetical protein